MILQIYTIIQTLISLVAIFTSFVILFGMLATVHVVASQRAPFSLGGITLFTVSKQTTKQRQGNIMNGKPE